MNSATANRSTCALRIALIAVLLWILAAVAPTSAGASSGQVVMHPLQGAAESSGHGDSWPYNGKTIHHTGLDLSTTTGATGGAVKAAADGRVVAGSVEAGCQNAQPACGAGFGNSLILEHELVGGGKLYTVYAHLAPGSVNVQAGGCVAQGDVIGTEGKTGEVTGTHLHFETNDVPTKFGHSGAIAGSRNPNDVIGTTQVNAICGGLGGPAAGGATGDVVGDFDGDGKDDVATLRRTADNATSLVVSWGHNRQQTSRSTPWSATWGGEIYNVGAGDFDGDGKDDLATLRRFDNGTARLVVSWGHTRQTMSRSVVWEADWSAGSIFPVGAGDFDGDGLADVAVIRRFADNTTRMVISWGHTRQTMSRSVVWEGIWADGIHPAGAGDFDGDGLDDAAVVRRFADNTTRMVISWGHTRQAMSRSVVWEAKWGGEIHPSGVGDFDNDGQADIAVIRRPTGTTTNVIVSWGATREHMSRSMTWSAQWGGEIHPQGAGDLDGDGKADIASVRRTAGNNTRLVVSWGGTRQAMSRSIPWAATWGGEIH